MYQNNTKTASIMRKKHTLKSTGTLQKKARFSRLEKQAAYLRPVRKPNGRVNC